MKTDLPLKNNFPWFFLKKEKFKINFLKESKKPFCFKIISPPPPPKIVPMYEIMWEKWYSQTGLR